MATYKKDINQIITLTDTATAIDRSHNPRDKFLLAILYLTGARPVELAKHLKRSDFDDDPESTHLRVRIYTAKLQRAKGFIEPHRTLDLPKSAPFVANIIIPYLHANDDDPEGYLIGVTPDRIRAIVYRATKNQFCPYHFRHSRIYKLAQAGATNDQLQNWKGARDIRSISAYLAGKPIGKNLTIE